MRQHVVYIHDLCMTLTFDLYVGGEGILGEFYSVFNLLHVILKGYQPLRTMPQIHVCITFITKENVSCCMNKCRTLSSFDMKMT